MEVSRKGIERNKLTLLHILREFDTRLSDNQLLEMVTELDLMGYFDLNSCLRDLADNGLLKRDEAINGIFYSITEMGSETLDFFKKQVPFSLRQELSEYAEVHRDDFAMQSRIFSEYMEIGDHQYRVILRLVENSIPVFEITFFAHSREEAEMYVNSWRRNALEIYENTFRDLMKA
ncbi:MAG: DUF4364 family protein [Christensenellaceae bacterium]|nr:DUF4364 family protein [Christensenellaceae bacterium]